MRNTKVQEAVQLLVGQVDRLIGGEALGVPAPSHIADIFDTHVKEQGGSVRLACAFFAAYSLFDYDWDYSSVPTGIRGRYGDKLLASELTSRHITFHHNITAFGENLGWKGAVRNFNLSKDERFLGFLSGLKALSDSDRRLLVNHIAWRLQSSQAVPQALPPLPSSYLSYARSLNLCEKLVATSSEGHIQQFIVAAFLEVHRKRIGHRVETHHPHASDKYDNKKGDIEEYSDTVLVAAYEVTVRNDWKNRLSDFEAKALEGELPKYIILASDVRNDPELYPAEKLIDYVDHLSFDLAVVDLTDFFAVFCAELRKDEIHSAFNSAYRMLNNPKLCGRNDIIQEYCKITKTWLEG